MIDCVLRGGISARCIFGRGLFKKLQVCGAEKRRLKFRDILLEIASRNETIRTLKHGSLDYFRRFIE